ncbi:glycosyltransferase family 39 protein [Granulicella sp. 5B5]|uniref:glycosyltransferase family 39 protein n=1 Tax=Granulicella sp. 5B5 TaxID=1617967 RepID=UPI0015F3EBC3|nr:glycosyltransferase family 39 protein [Granulicella sp. 5B5]
MGQLKRLIQGKWSRAAMVAGLLLVMAAQLVWVSRRSSATWDEPHHLFDGYMVLTRHTYTLNPEVPPLVKLVAALPLLGRGLAVPADHGWSVPREAFRDGRDFVFGNGVGRTLELGRLACMGFTLALGLLIYCMAAEMFGYGAGLFALALYVVDPNFLAHGALVTTDVGSACLFVAALYVFYRYSGRPTWGRLLLAGFAAGLLLAAKFTGVFLAPMLVLLVLAEWVVVRSWKPLRERAVALVVVFAMAWVVLWGFYGFRYSAGVNGGDIDPPLSAYLARMYDRADAPRLAMLAKYHVLPEAYLWGLENTKQTEFEDTSYLWGKVYRHGNWWYFPVALAVKSTLPFLLLLVAGLVLMVVLPTSQKRDVGHPALWLLVPTGLYFAVAMHSDFDIGVRHLLPVYALLYVLVGGVASVLVQKDARWMYALGVLLCWQVVTSERVAPAYMAYGNEAWGGPLQVHRYLSDANVDWGQQLIAVKRYIDEHHVAKCWFAYFPDGAIEPEDYGMHCGRLPTTSTVWWLDLPEAVPPVIDGTVFVSDGDLEGIEFGDGALNPYEVFRERRPDAVIDYGVDVYNGSFAVPLASALVTAHDADKRLSAGDKDGALALAEQAAGLAPESAPVEIELGDVLAALGRRDEALARYRAAMESAERVRPDLQASFIAAAQEKVHALEAR